MYKHFHLETNDYEVPLDDFELSTQSSSLIPRGNSKLDPEAVGVTDYPVSGTNVAVKAQQTRMNAVEFCQ